MCKERLREAIKKDESLKGDLERAEERTNRFMARKLEQADREAAENEVKRLRVENAEKEPTTRATNGEERGELEQGTRGNGE